MDPKDNLRDAKPYILFDEAKVYQDQEWSGRGLKDGEATLTLKSQESPYLEEVRETPEGVDLVQAMIDWQKRSREGHWLFTDDFVLSRTAMSNAMLAKQLEKEDLDEKLRQRRQPVRLTRRQRRAQKRR